MNVLLVTIAISLPIGVALITTDNNYIPNSPCPTVFKYHRLNVSDVWVAFVYVPPPNKLMPIKLDVFLYLEGILPTKYAGILELLESRDTVTSRLAQSILQPIVYIIRFPLPHPLPTVKHISSNNVPLCIGVPVVGPIITTIHLEHSLFPRIKYPTRPPTKNDRVLTDGGGTRINLPPITEKKQEPNIYDECGQVTIVSVNPLVAGGKPIHRGEWPWLVAIFISQTMGLQFHCSGTLISDRFVLTGHCVSHDATGVLAPNSVLVYLGKHNLRNWTEPDSLLKQVIDIHIHPSYERYNFASDLALVEFSPVNFTATLKPVCLWTGSLDLDTYVGLMGTVVGWGRGTNETKLKDEPHQLQLEIVSQEECLRSHVNFKYLTSDKTICAGNRNGTGPCNGDSGAGLVLFNNRTSRWELRGIVSVSLLDASNSCDLNEYIVFTDTAKFLDWLMKFIT